MSLTPVVHRERRISLQIFENIQLGTQGKMIHDKEVRFIISWSVPLKPAIVFKKHRIFWWIKAWSQVWQNKTRLNSGKLCYNCLYLILYNVVLKYTLDWNAVKERTCRRNIRLIEGNAKCRHQINLPWKGLCGSCLSVWGPEPHTPPHTLYTCIQYTYSHSEGGGGGLNQGES